MVEKTYATANSIILMTAIHFVIDTHFIHYTKEKIFIYQVKYLSSICTNILHILTLTLFCWKTAQEANKLAALQSQFPIKSNLIGLRILNFILEAKHEKVAFRVITYLSSMNRYFSLLQPLLRLSVSSLSNLGQQIFIHYSFKEFISQKNRVNFVST
ncbi:uncharacterized protein LOC123007408 [Tribolium madens]|uniref:uncharacterized protein LOC123007408 n=1 Tax=Tribolium madens TaxID=41895 RepID=UPI001CF75D77|nr:uncharacterized protein LOC123007408 [Tribolium madens]